MPGTEYTASDKVVQKMSRDGLTEENLRTGEKKLVGTAGEDAHIRDSPEVEMPLDEEDAFEEIEIDESEREPPDEAALRMEEGHARNGKKRQRKGRKDNGAGNEEEDAFGLEDRSDRLHFDDEGNRMVRAKDMGWGKRTVSRAAAVSSAAIHRKLYEADDENAAVESAHRSERAAEGAAGLAANKVGHKASRQTLKRSADEEKVAVGKLQFTEGTHDAAAALKPAADSPNKKSVMKRASKKQRYREAAKAFGAGAAGIFSAGAVSTGRGSAAKKARGTIGKRSGRKSTLYVTLIVFFLAFLLLIVSIVTSSVVVEGVGSVFLATTYSSTDRAIHAVEDAYLEMEEKLQAEINRIETDYPGYDEYNYQIDEIGHNPYLLISYFSAMYGEFTYRQMASELEEIFDLQYSLSTESETETVTETKTVRVGESLGSVVTSGYCNCSICCGKWAGGTTASGAYPTSSHTLAVDAYNPIVPIGTRVVMNGVEYTVEDTGNLAANGVDFDVYYDSHQAVLAHGHQTWVAYLSDSNGSTTVEVTSTEETSILYVTVTNNDLDAILRERMDVEQEVWYDLYNSTYGNRSDLFDLTTISSGSVLAYDIPEEALSDEKFANMITEAEKYLGMAYQWGGSSPETGFDCSGFVSWVINHCGNGWSYGRLSANGLMEICDIIPESEAQPGDLVFFQGTYDTSGASHVGIYVGDGMMIHCGDPISYTSIESSYWQQHFYCFGRIR